MKIILLSSLACILLYHLSYSQCTSKGITTNPSAPVNNELPSNKNLYFDWTQQYLNNNSTCQLNQSVESPFYKVDNLEALRASKDMLPIDGWELIRRDLGYTNTNAKSLDVPQHTYFILYNKYTGVLRILLKVCRGLDYNGVKITLRFDATSSFQTALLSLTDNVIKDLTVTHVKNPAAQSVATFINDDTKWFFADFPMAYDPCTCQFKSKLNIITNLIQNSTISLQGSITGNITSITNGSGSVSNDGKFNFKDFATNTTEKFSKTYDNVDKMITQTKSISDILFGATSDQSKNLTKFADGLKSNDFLKAGLAAVPWIKSAVALFDLFIGGGKSSTQPTQIMPLAVNLTTALSGSISTSNQYHNIIFSNPGSLDAEKDPSTYPFYNETLGVFNLLTPPTFYNAVVAGPPSYDNKVKIKLNEPIKWVLNPASGLQLQDAQCAFVATPILNSEGTTSTALPTFFADNGFTVLEGKDVFTGRYSWRTEYIDVNCLSNNFDFAFYYKSANLIFRPTVTFKLILNFKKINDPTGQNILQVFNFPLKFVGEFPTKNIDWTHTKFNPTSCVGGYFKQANSLDKNLFCVSTAYITNRSSRVSQNSRPSDSLRNANNEIFMVSPNPAYNDLTVSLANGEIIKTFSLINTSGQAVILNRAVGNSNIVKLDVRNFSSGIYVLKVVTAKKVLTKKVVLSGK